MKIIIPTYDTKKQNILSTFMENASTKAAIKYVLFKKIIISLYKTNTACLYVVVRYYYVRIIKDDSNF